MADVKAIITDTARRYGVDPDVAIRIAQIESSLNPSAKNPKSSAGGLYQFIDSTWATYGGGKSKYDPQASADAGMRFIRDNVKFLKKRLGRDPSPGEIYLAHQQGAGGAALILSNPSANAMQLLGEKKVALNGGNASMTAGEFAALWDKKIGLAGGSPSLVQGGDTPASMTGANGFQTDQPAAASYEDVVPADSLSRREEIEQEKALEAAGENAPGLVEGAGLAAWNNWSVLAPFRALGHHDPDPNWRLTDEGVKQLGEGIPNEYLAEFEDAISEAHAQAIRQRLLAQMETNQKIASMGTTGTVLSFAAGVLDPGAIAATAAIGAATGGLGLPAAVAARFGRAGMVGMGVAEGVVGNLATDIPLNLVDPTMKASDLKYSIGTGIVMGGAFGAFRKNPAFQKEAEGMVALGRTMRKEAMPSGSTAGAAQVVPSPSYRSDSDELRGIYSSITKQTEVVFGRARFDLTGQMLKSQNPMVRKVARYLTEDAVRAKPGQVTEIAASEAQSRLMKTSTNEWIRGYGDAWDKYRKRNKIGLFKSADALEQFKLQVADYVDETDPFNRIHAAPEVKEAATAFNTVMQKWWKLATDEGITRSEAGASNYFPRYMDLSRARELTHRFGYQMDDRLPGLTGLFRDAILKAQPTIEPKLALRMGHAIVDRMHKLQAGQELSSGGIDGLDLDNLKGVLTGYLDPDEIDEIDEILLKINKPEPNPDAGGNGRLMHRVIFDVNHEAVLKDRSGVEQTVRVKDFYIRDPNLAMHLYNRQMSGQIAMARVKIRDPKTGEMLVDGIKNRTDWETFKQKVIGVGDLEGANNADDIKNLDFAYNAITGVPNFDETTDWAAFTRSLRDFNFARLMGQVGFSQIPEMGRMASQVGLKALYQGMPSFRQLIELVRTGRLSDEMADELDALGAFGTDYERTRFYVHADDYGTPITLGSGTKLGQGIQKVSPALHSMNRFVSKYSGMAPINSLFQRWASRSFAVKFVRMAMFGDKINVNRMKALGLSQEDFDLIVKNIKAHAKFKGGGKKATKLEALGMKDWDGPAVAAFESALYRASRNMILENDVGQFAKWMGSPIGKVFLQFRTFAISSWTKATLQGLNLRDAEAGIGFLASSFLGAAVYAGQTHINLIGDPDRDRKLKERLSWDRLGMAGFQRTSESSLLPVPMDVVSEMVTGNPAFDMRSSGLQTTADNLFGNPTMDLVSTGFKAVKGISTAVTGDDYSQPDFRNLTKTLPFQRMMGFVQFYNWLASGFPQREIRD